MDIITEKVIKYSSFAVISVRKKHGVSQLPNLSPPRVFNRFTSIGAF